MSSITPLDFDLEFEEIYVMKVGQNDNINPPTDDTTNDDLIIFDESVPVAGSDGTLIVF